MPTWANSKHSWPRLKRHRHLLQNQNQRQQKSQRQHSEEVAPVAWPHCWPASEEAKLKQLRLLPSRRQPSWLLQPLRHQLPHLLRRILEGVTKELSSPSYLEASSCRQTLR